MAPIKTPALKRFIAEQIIESVSEDSESVLYLAVGKPTEWANEAAPDQAVNSTDEINGIWNNMHFLKKITGNDISMVVRRIDWVSNTVYSAYTHTGDNSNSNFYVLNSDWNVYKCLENNRGRPSTSRPTYTGTATTNRTSDGYLWKYMYTLSRAQRLRFLTSDYMPVRTLTLDDGSPQYDVQSNAIDGSIEAIRVVNPGNNYSSNVAVTISINGDGTGATANAVMNTSINSIQYVVVTNKGSGYTWANVTITSNNTNANNATGEVIISPYGGHGSDPAGEMDVRGLMIDVRLKGDENQTVKVGDDFRQIALIRDPEHNETGNVASNTILNQVVTLSLSGAGASFEVGEWAFQGVSLTSATFKGVVVWYESNEMQLTNTSGTLASSLIFGQTSAASRYVADYTDPNLVPRSGDVLYIDNIRPITRANTQTENIQIPIIF